MSEVNMWEFENKYFEQGIEWVCGVDEAGRGCLAGPVCAAAVILPANIVIPGLNDSKKISDKKRRELYPVIKEQALAYSIAFASHREIDSVNILQATFLAMERAINGLKIKPEIALIDGNRAKDFGVPVETIIGGDGCSASIAAASVLAKVTRDDVMLEMAKTYPGYAFEIHKGYGTKAHYAALTQMGPCEIHRMTFLKKFYGEK
ncbi:MAG: ribonuclease HII [Oscillospiraceae bacterium]|nr:ribonuclease HII [Oscillospiraceae bacterium]